MIRAFPGDDPIDLRQGCECIRHPSGLELSADKCTHAFEDESIFLSVIPTNEHHLVSTRGEFPGEQRHL